ncbi:uncharacterized protein LOC115620291 [Scaptodrosophila lebanonensis]|uniref:Uncharacterized protein LOC115620291 n=1 Tax=Drosophila lebanonensis TaxID=7225 RepID=A0A6J2T294_DROLE|nr:uncharacterized protein LOC115620291 [Scaptodrosophila lebanonensis]
MANIIWHFLFVATSATIPIVCSGAAVEKISSMPIQLTSIAGKGVKAQVHDSYGHNNMAIETMLYDNRWAPEPPPSASRKQPYNSRYHYTTKFDENGGALVTKRRSYSESLDGGSAGGGGGGGIAAVLNGLTNLSGLGHISNGYGSVAPTRRETLAIASTKQEIPIYEEQHEDASIAALAVAANNLGSSDAGSGGDGGENNHQHSSAGVHTAIYDFPAGSSSGFLPSSYGTGTGSGTGNLDHNSWTPTTPKRDTLGEGVEYQSGHAHAFDKISVGNFLHHYEHNSGYDEHQHPLHAIAEAASSGPSEYQQHHNDGHDGEGPNYLPETAGNHAQLQHSHHTDIINYLPYPVVKKQHIPVEKPVPVPVSHAVIVPVRKPVPIHIPITKQVQVPVEQELKIPIERVVPYPVEKLVPVPVEKRLPYHVVKYVPIKIPKPFPVKVPVFKTVLHKVKGWW